MSTELAYLRRGTLAVVVAAFSFGIGTLWMEAFWPFAAFQTAIVSTACVWLFAALWRPEARMNAWLALPFCVAALGTGQLLLGRTENAWQTRQSVFEWTTHGCAALLAYQVCRDARLRAFSLRAFALMAGLLALLSTAQNYAAPGRVLWLFDSGYAEGVFGPFVYHTKLANFAELAIPVALWLAVHEGRGRALYGAAAVALAGAVVASASRGGIVVLALELVILGVMAGRRGPMRRARMGTALAFAGVLIVGAALGGWELALDRFSTDPLRDLRLPIAISAAEMARHYWLTGSGLGTWSTVYPEFAQFDIHVVINQAHCDWLQWLSEGGIVFPAIMLLLAAAVLRAARREWWVLGVIFVWLHGAWDYPMQQTPAFASLQIAFCGAALGLQDAGQPRSLVMTYSINRKAPSANA